MTDAFVYRKIEEQHLEESALPLTQLQSEQLGLSSHRELVAIEFLDITYECMWEPKKRVLTGIEFFDSLINEIRIGEQLAFAKDVDHILVRILDEGTALPEVEHIQAAKQPTLNQTTRKRKKRKQSGNRYRLRSADEYQWSRNVGVLDKSLKQLLENIGNKGWDDPKAYQIRMRGESLASVSGFDELLAAHLAHIEPMQHQYSAAIKALSSMNGRAILADEVGLGKTIEAGLIIKELQVRGLATRVLIICPASLRDQWKSELKEKFEIESRIVTSGSDTFTIDSLIISSTLAARDPVQGRLLNQPFDLVVVDEAHRCINPNTKIFKFVKRLSKRTRYCLLLTATPVQNRLTDLYHLVELIKPGTFKSRKDFLDRYVSQGDNDRTPKDPDGLRRLLADVMIRTTRSQAGFDRVKRRVKERAVRLNEDERKAYHELINFLRSMDPAPGDHLRRQRWAQRLILSPRSLAKSLLSSDRFHGADAQMLEALADNALEATTNSRLKALTQQVSTWVKDETKGKVIIFTNQVDVAEDIQRVLSAESIPSVAFFGAQDNRRKALEEFEGDVPVLVATEAGAEGLNLQFANCLINYDLPWNPMKIEQRIGRIDRLTQKRDVFVRNFYSPDTVEDNIYRILSEKIRMFELLFGQVTLVLGEFAQDKDSRSFESQILDAVLSESGSESEFAKIADKAVEARSVADEQFGVQDELNRWMATTDFSHRDDLTVHGDETLLPHQVQADKGRQALMKDFVADLLRHFGAAVSADSEPLHPNEFEEGVARQSYLSADLPTSELRNALGGVDRIHLAFHPDGLNFHAEAELCAAGSDIFEELIDFIREEGDLVISLPDYDQVPMEALLDAANGVQFVGTEILGPSTWDVEANWLIRFGGESGPSEVIVSGTSPPAISIDYRHLKEDDDKPRTLVDATVRKQLLEDFHTTAAERSSEMAQLGQKRLTAQREELRSRLKSEIQKVSQEMGQGSLNVNTQKWSRLNERYEDLQGQLDEVKTETIKAIEPEIRAELLGAVITGGPVIAVKQTWRRTDGKSRMSELKYSLVERCVVESLGDDGKALETVAICDHDHVIDAKRIFTCDACLGLECDQCKLPVHITCALCRRNVCASCQGSDAFCTSCLNPTEIVPSVLPDFRQFILGDGRVLSVGLHEAQLENIRIPSRSPLTASLSRWLVTNVGSKNVNLSFESISELSKPEGSYCSIWEEHGFAYEIQSEGNAGISPMACQALGVDWQSVGDTGDPIEIIVDRLREQYFVQSPTVHVRQTAIRTCIAFHSGQPVFEKHVHRADGSVRVIRSEIGWQPTPNDPLDVDARVACFADEDVKLTLSRLYLGYRLDVTARERHQQRSFYIVTQDGQNQESQVLLSRISRLLQDRLGYRIGWIDNPFSIEPGISNSEVALVSQKSVVALETAAIQSASLASAEVLLSFNPGWSVVKDEAIPLLEELSGTGQWAQDLDHSRAATTHTLTPVVTVTERWRGEGVFEGEYRIGVNHPSGRSAILPEGDFIIDRGGHPTLRRSAAVCPICTLHSCKSCPNELQVISCSACNEPVCATCVKPTVLVDSLNYCATCSDPLCPRCQRDQGATQCPICSEGLCQKHGDDPYCGGCAKFKRVLPSEYLDLPSEIMANGHLVLSREMSGGRRLLLVAGGLRREFIELNEQGVITAWSSTIARTAAELSFQLGWAHRGPVSTFEVDVVNHPRMLFDSNNSDRQVGSYLSKPSPPLTGAVITDQYGKMVGFTTLTDLEQTIGELYEEISGCSTLSDDRIVNFSYRPGVAETVEELLAPHSIPAGRSVVLHVDEQRVTMSAQQYSHALPNVVISRLVAGMSVQHLVSWPLLRQLLGQSNSENVIDAGTDDGRTTVKWMGYSLVFERFGNSVDICLYLAKHLLDSCRLTPAGQPVELDAQIEAVRKAVGGQSGILVAGNLGECRTPEYSGGVTVESRSVIPRLRVKVLPAGPTEHAPLGPDHIAGLRKAFPTQHGSDSDRHASSTDNNMVALHAAVLTHLMEPVERKLLVDIHHSVRDRLTSENGSTGSVYSTVTKYESIGDSAATVPFLHHPSEKSWEFEIDRSGHLVGLGRTTTCDVCGEASCPHCQAENRVKNCDSCGQESCGSCQIGPSTRHDQPLCSSCDRTLCTACSRHGRSTKCEICRRSTCHHCIEAGRCKACSSFELFDPVDTPDWLRSKHLTVYRGVHRSSTVYFAFGGSRFDVAVVEDGARTSWTTYTDLSSLEWALLYEASQYGVWFASELQRVDVPTYDGPREILREHRSHLVGFLLRPGDPTSQHLFPSSKISHEDKPDEVRSWSERPPAAIELWETVQKGRSTVPTVHLVETQALERLVVQPSGIEITVSEGYQSHTDFVPMVPSTDLENRKLYELADTSSSVEYSSRAFPRVYAEKYTLGPISIVHIEDGETNEWIRVDSSSVTGQSVMLGHAFLGANVPVNVHQSALFNEVEPLRITNGELLSRSASYQWEVVDEFAEGEVPVADMKREVELLEAMGHSLLPELVLPSIFTSNDSSEAQFNFQPNWINVFPLISEEIKVHGEVLEIEYLGPHSPGLASQRAYDTGDPSNEFFVDRSFHMVTHPLTCDYCAESVCRRCEDPMVGCVVCNQPMCLRCAKVFASHTLCEACSEYGADTSLQAKLGRLKLFSFKGQDAVHTVSISPPRNGVARVKVERGTRTSEHVIDESILDWLKAWHDTK